MLRFTEDDVKEALEVAEEFHYCFAGSLLQRKLKCSFNMAMEIMDELERRKYIGKYDGVKPRKVFLEKFSQKKRLFGTSVEETQKWHSSYNDNLRQDSQYNTFGGVKMNQVGRPPVVIDKDVLRSVYKKAGSIRRASEMLGVSKNTFNKLLIENGIERQSMRWVMPD